MFGRRYTLFRLFGFRIGVDLSWVLLAVLITWSLAAGFFPAQFPDQSQAVYWSMGLIGAIGLFGSIIFHELAHALTARRYGLEMGGITLFLFGGVAEMTQEPNSPRAEFVVAIAGPIASFILAGVLWGLHSVALALGWPAVVVGVIVYLGIINFILAAFNLIPAFPLDGGRMLRAVLWGWKGDLRYASRIASGFGSAFGILLIVLGVLNVVTGNFIGGMWWFLIGLFLRGIAGASYQQTLTREALRGEPVSRVMTRDPIAVPTGINLARLTDDYFYRHYFKTFPVVDGDGRVAGCISIKQLGGVPREDWDRVTVGEIMASCGDDNTVRPDMDAMDAMTRMRSRNQSRLLVVDRERLVGILSQSDLMRFLNIKLELDEGPAGERQSQPKPQPQPAERRAEPGPAGGHRHAHG